MANTLESFINTLRSILPSKDAKAAIVAQTGRGFQVKMENNGNRAIISPEYNAKDFSREFAHSANGIVIDVTDGKVLAVPIPRYNPKPTDEFYQYSPEKFDKYTIEKVQDGTVLTLYYYHDEWQISSTGGFSMANMRWIGHMTYMDMLLDIMPDLFSRLDKNFSYTIGMHHPAIHPLPRDPRRIWLYWACDLCQANADKPKLVFSRPDIGLDFPQTVKLSLALIREGNEKALSAYLAGEQPEYGYILRGSFEEFGANANILLESTLGASLKKLFYNISKRYSEHRTITPDTRTRYICVIAYFTDKARATFLYLFPQFRRYFEQIGEIVDLILRQTLLAAGNKKARDSLRRLPNGDGVKSLVKSTTKIVLDKLEGNGTVFQTGAQGARSIVYDFLMRDGISVNYWCKSLVPVLTELDMPEKRE